MLKYPVSDFYVKNKVMSYANFWRSQTNSTRVCTGALEFVLLKKKTTRTIFIWYLLTLAFSIISLANDTSPSWFVDKFAMTYARGARRFFIMLWTRWSRYRRSSVVALLREMPRERGRRRIDFFLSARHKWPKTFEARSVGKEIGYIFFYI